MYIGIGIHMYIYTYRMYMYICTLYMYYVHSTCMYVCMYPLQQYGPDAIMFHYKEILYETL